MIIAVASLTPVTDSCCVLLCRRAEINKKTAQLERARIRYEKELESVANDLQLLQSQLATVHTQREDAKSEFAGTMSDRQSDKSRLEKRRASYHNAHAAVCETETSLGRELAAAEREMTETVARWTIETAKDKKAFKAKVRQVTK